MTGVSIFTQSQRPSLPWTGTLSGSQVGAPGGGDDEDDDDGGALDPLLLAPLPELPLPFGLVHGGTGNSALPPGWRPVPLPVHSLVVVFDGTQRLGPSPVLPLAPPP